MEPKSPKSCMQMKGSRNEEAMSTFVGKWVMVAAEGPEHLILRINKL